MGGLCRPFLESMAEQTMSPLSMPAAMGISRWFRFGHFKSSISLKWNFFQGEEENCFVL